MACPIHTSFRCPGPFDCPAMRMKLNSARVPHSYSSPSWVQERKWSCLETTYGIALAVMLVAVVALRIINIARLIGIILR